MCLDWYHTFSQGSVILFFASTINKLIKCVCACVPICMPKCAFVGQWIICGSFIPENMDLRARPQVLMLGRKYLHLYTLSHHPNFIWFSFFFLLPKIISLLSVLTLGAFVPVVLIPISWLACRQGEIFMRSRNPDTLCHKFQCS